MTTNRRPQSRALALAALFALAGCSSGALTPSRWAYAFGPVIPSAPWSLADGHSGTTPIAHVVIVIQENRSFDDLFARFPGADGAAYGEMRVKRGSRYVDRRVALAPHALVMSQDVGHCHSSFETAYDHAKMDGFNLVPIGSCGSEGKGAGMLVYQYVEEQQIEPYWDIARHWVLADHLFQTQASGSFTAHQDLIRGGTLIGKTKSLIDAPDGWPWGCDAHDSVRTWVFTPSGGVSKDGPFPCSNRFPNYHSYDTLRDLLDTAGVSWKYYTPCFSKSDGCNPEAGCPDCGGDLLNAFDVIYPVRYGTQWKTNVSMPETNVLKDVRNHALPAVSWVIPGDDASDHPSEKVDNGPSWVASIVNAIGKSSYWKSSAIFVLWDDWGGFYDNAVPPFQDNYGGLGFRVPMLVISPYAIAGKSKAGGYVAHTPYEFASILKYVEENWDLGSLGTTDRRATSARNLFDYAQKPRPFAAIPSRFGSQYFLSRPAAPQHGDPE